MLSPSSAHSSVHAVHTWYACLDQPEPVVAELQHTLAEDELARMHRYHFAADARRYVMRRGVLRHLLAAYLHRPPTKIAFTYGPREKPALVASMNAADLRFNLSDSGEMAIYAFTIGTEIGVDIEMQRECPNALQMAERFFSPTESAWLHSQPLAEQADGFLRCWTGKEAVVKALGDGLYAPLAEFTVAHWQTRPEIVWPARPELKWSLHTLHPPRGYTASLAVAGHVDVVREQHCTNLYAPPVACLAGLKKPALL